MARANQPDFVIDAGPDWLLIDLGQATLISHKLSNGGRTAIVRTKEIAKELAAEPRQEAAASLSSTDAIEPHASGQKRLIGALLHYAGDRGCTYEQVRTALEALGIEPTDNERRVIDHCFLRQKSC